MDLNYIFPIYENEGSLLEMSRITHINHDLFNCNYINNTSLVKWKYLNRQSIGVPYKEEVTFNLNEEFKNKLLYGVEIFDKDDEDRVYYLEWDIKEQETKGEIFKNHLLGLEGNVNPQSFFDYEDMSMRKYSDNTYYNDTKITTPNLKTREKIK